MIKEYQKFEHNGVKFEANWKEKVKPCKSIKITVKGKSAEIDKNDLYALLMLYADDKQMEASLAQKPFKKITRMLQAKLKEDKKKGDVIVFPLTYEVPEEVYIQWEKENKDKMLSKEEAKDKLK